MKKALGILIIICSLCFFGTKPWASSDIIAEVNDIKITVDEFNEIAQGRADRENLLNQIIASLLLAKEAKKEGLEKDPIVQQQLSLIKEQQLALFFYQKKVTEKTKVSDKELDQLIPPWERKKIRFRQIITQTESEATNIYNQLKKGASFEKLAKEKSKGRYAKKGGDIGFVIINTNIFPEEVEQVIFKLKDGKISKPIKTREGYSIFKAVERKNLSDKELESKKNYLQFKISKEKTDRITNALLNSLRSKAKVKIFDENLKKIENDQISDKELLKTKVAEVNKTTLTLNDLIGGQQSAYGNPLESPLLKNPSFLKNMIEDKIKNILFVLEAKRIGMEKDPEFQRRTKIFADGVLANKYALDILCKNIKVTEAEYRQYYNEHKNDPQLKNTPERVKAKHILVDDPKLADTIVNRLKKGGDFSKLAKEYSKDQFTAEKGGELGYMPRGRMDHLFEETVFNMKIDETKKIERSNYGGQGKSYDIIMVLDKKPAGANKFEDVIDIIEPIVLYKKREKKITDFIEKLKATAKIKKNMDLVNTSPTPNAPRIPPAPMI